MVERADAPEDAVAPEIRAERPGPERGERGAHVGDAGRREAPVQGEDARLEGRVVVELEAPARGPRGAPVRRRQVPHLRIEFARVVHRAPQAGGRRGGVAAAADAVLRAAINDEEQHTDYDLEPTS